MPSPLAERWAALRARLPASVDILPVTKGQPAEVLKEALSMGLRRFGENRVQEARDKAGEMAGSGAEFDLIGPLQGNKAGAAAALFARVQTLSDPSTAQALSRRVSALGRKMEVLIQFNCSGEDQKRGLRETGEAEALGALCLELPGLDLKGLMTLGPYPAGEKVSREAFSRLRKLRDQLQQRLGRNFPLLSMGMSEDLDWAIMEGSNLVRVGRALFGERRKK